MCGGRYKKGGTKGERFKGKNDGRMRGYRRGREGGREGGGRRESNMKDGSTSGGTCSYPMSHKLHPPLPSPLTCSCFFTSSQYFMASVSLFLSSSYSLSACREGRGCCPNSDSVRPIPTKVGRHLPLINCSISDYSITAHRLRCLLLVRYEQCQSVGACLVAGSHQPTTEICCNQHNVAAPESTT